MRVYVKLLRLHYKKMRKYATDKHGITVEGVRLSRFRSKCYRTRLRFKAIPIIYYLQGLALNTDMLSLNTVRIT